MPIFTTAHLLITVSEDLLTVWLFITGRCFTSIEAAPASSHVIYNCSASGQALGSRKVRHYVSSSLLPCKYSNSIGVNIIVISSPGGHIAGKRSVTRVQCSPGLSRVETTVCEDVE